MKWKLFTLCFLTCGFTISLVQSQTVSRKKNLYLGGFFAVELTEQNWRGGGIIPSVQMAIDDINNRSDILTDYNLVVLWNDTKVTIKVIYITKFYNDTIKLYSTYLGFLFSIVRCSIILRSIKQIITS